MSQYDCVYVYSYGVHRDLHSFPTRRSSDLLPVLDRGRGTRRIALAEHRGQAAHGEAREIADHAALAEGDRKSTRLNSLRHLVCRLLLEKKNNSLDLDPEREHKPRNRPQTAH